MPLLPLPVALLFLVCAGAGSAADGAPSRFERVGLQHPVVSAVERYAVDIPADEALRYDGAFAAQFPHGLPFAPGSGLALKSADRDGNLLFWSLGDRGPNADSPRVIVDGRTSDAKIFLTPGFVPRLAEIRVERGQRAYVAHTLPLSEGGQALSGLPLPPGQTGATGEVPLDDGLAILPFSTLGIDPEGVAVGAPGRLWIVDEYGPFLAEVDARSGALLRKLAPGSGLPAELAARQPNRGFEGVAVTPAGKVYAAVQSTLDIDGKTRSTARFTRLVEFDPRNGAVRQLAYPIDVEAYRKAGDAKIGDLVALNDTQLLLIEQGKDRHGVMRNIVYAIDIGAAEDLTAKRTREGKAMEFAGADEIAALAMIRKTKVLDLREIGWSAEKAEGLALIDGGLAVINDNDFGLSSEIDGEQGDDPGRYTISAGRLSGNGRLRVNASGEATQLWLLQFRQPLGAFFAD